ncbi:flagellar filament capping protein FliD [Xylophilus sp. GW821-FHT01B05]
MASISSIGIGSGLDVKSIVSQMVALEKQPLVALQSADATIQSKISTYGQIKSLVSTFADAAAKLTRDSGWNSMTVASTNSTAATATVSGITKPGSYSVTVSQLAQSQTSVSATAVTAGASMGAGTLTLQVGSGTAVNLEFAEGDKTSLADIAGKINDKNTGLVATVVSDSSGERLMLRSSATGASSAFTVTASGFSTDNATAALSFTQTQAAQDTKAKLNGMDITSATRNFDSVVSGLNFSVSQVSTSPVDITVTADTATTKQNIQDFVDAYNAINDLLSTSVKYDADTKTAGLLQGDSTAVGLQNTLRAALGSSTAGGAYATLSDIGISVIKDGNGKLGVDSTKLDAALKNKPDDLKNLFANSTSGSDGSNGVAVRLRTLTTSMLSFSGGLFSDKTDALTAADKRNQAEQDKVNARAAVVEARLNAQYTALDTKMASLTALNTYITQQVANWNKSS